FKNIFFKIMKAITNNNIDPISSAFTTTISATIPIMGINKINALKIALLFTGFAPNIFFLTTDYLLLTSALSHPRRIPQYRHLRRHAGLGEDLARIAQISGIEHFFDLFHEYDVLLRKEKR